MADKKILQKKIAKLLEEEQKLVKDNMPKFDRGIIEAAAEREKAIWDDIAKVLKKHSVMPSVVTRIVSENEAIDNSVRPALTCNGIEVTLRYIANPIGKEGKTGKFPAKVTERIGEIRREISEISEQLEDNEGE